MTTPTTEPAQTFQAPVPAVPGQPSPIPRAIPWNEPITPTTTPTTAATK